MDSLKDILGPARDALEQQIRVKEKWLREGVTFLPNVFIADKTISSNAKVLFLALCMHRFNKEFCFPSYDLLAEELGWSRATISRAAKELEKIGVIKIKRTGRSNVVEIAFEALDERVERVIAHLKEVRAKTSREFHR